MFFECRSDGHSADKCNKGQTTPQLDCDFQPLIDRDQGPPAMRLINWHSVAIVALTCGLMAVQQAASEARDAPGRAVAQSEDFKGKTTTVGPGNEQQRADHQPAGMFDFSTYKRLFGKSYGSIVEELVRKKYYLAKAFRAFISNIKYKFRSSRYFLSVNFMSDMAPAEQERMKNKELAKMFSEHPASTNEPGANSSTLDVGQVERDLYKVVREHKEVPGFGKLFRDLGGQLAGLLGRRKRETGARAAGGSNEQRPPLASSWSLLEHLFNVPKGAVDDDELGPSGEFAGKIESNNPDYVAPELVSLGIRDERLEQVTCYASAFLPDNFNEDGLVSHLEQTAGKLNDWMDDANGGRLVTGTDPSGAGQEGGEHIIYLDHRDSKCFFAPRSQGQCGCCYAFTAVALLEWLHCKMTGKLVAFSEQYMIDCGKSAGLDGCAGGNFVSTADFVHTYGTELRLNYPYRERQDQCPYDEDTDPRTMGYIRMRLGSLVQIKKLQFATYLPVTPIVAMVNTFDGWSEYGGGVYDGANCKPEPDHGVLLVGHGKLDGEEYWLLRNSHSVGWGEDGYMKLAKRARDCLADQGFIYGLNDGAIKFDLFRNDQNDPTNIKSHYGANMRRELETMQI